MVKPTSYAQGGCGNGDAPPYYEFGGDVAPNGCKVNCISPPDDGVDKLV